MDGSNWAVIELHLNKYVVRERQLIQFFAQVQDVKM